MNKYALKLMTALYLFSAFSAKSSDSDINISMKVVFNSIRHEFGAMRGSYITPRSLVSEQFVEALQDVTDETRLPDGNYLIAGCRPHSCIEEAAVILTPAGGIIAMGLINFHCHVSTAGATACDANPHLSIFLKSGEDKTSLSQRLIDWAKRQTSIEATETRNFGIGR